MIVPIIVAEAKDKAEFIKDYLGEGALAVVCPPGPLVDMLPPHGHEVASSPRFEALPAGQDLLDTLAGHPGEVILALDSHAQAEFICWQLRGYLVQRGLAPGRILRLRPAAFTPEALAAATAGMGPVDGQAGLAFWHRQLFDQRLARHLTRLIGTSKGPGGLPLTHRCLTVLFLLAEHEDERLRAQSLPAWRLKAGLTTGQMPFDAWLVLGPGGIANGLIRGETTVHALRQQLGSGSLLVEEVRRTPFVIPAPRPHRLASLIPEAHDRLGLTIDQTIAILARLFCGVETGGRRHGLIFYPESGDAQAVVARLRAGLAASLGPQVLDEAPPRPEPGMILPAWPEVNGRELAASLAPEEAGLYDLIHRRASQGQMRAANGESTTISCRAGNGCLFEAKFQRLGSPGFLALDLEARPGSPLPPNQLPAKGQSFKASLAMFTPEQAAPPSCTIDILIRQLADFAIPADHTIFSLLAAMIKANCLRLDREGVLTAGGHAMTAVSIVNKAFPRMPGITLAAYLEQTVAEANSGRKPLEFALAQFDQTIMLHGKVLLKPKVPLKLKPRPRTVSTIIKQPETKPTSPQLTAADEPAGNDVPPAQGPAASLEIVTAADIGLPPPEPTKAPALSIPAGAEVETAEAEAGPTDAPAPKADDNGKGEAPVWAEDIKRLFASSLAGAGPDPSPPAPAEPRDETETNNPAPLPPGAGPARLCPACGKPMLRREDRFGPFWGCSDFPVCRHSETLGPDDLDLPCPLCGQTLNRQQTPTGKGFYQCPNPGCQFMSWSLPHYLSCGICDSPYLIEKTGRAGSARLCCPRAGCPYEQPLPGLMTRDAPPSSSPPGAATRKVRLVRRRN